MKKELTELQRLIIALVMVVVGFILSIVLEDFIYSIVINLFVFLYFVYNSGGSGL